MPAIDLLKTPILQDSPLIIDESLPSDPALRSIIDDVLAKLHYSFVMAACEEQSTAPGSLDEIFRQFLASRSATSRSRYRERAQALLDAPLSLQATHFGRYTSLAQQEYRDLGSDRVNDRCAPISVDPEALKQSLVKLHTPFTLMPKLPEISEVEQEVMSTKNKRIKLKLDPDALSGLMFKKLRLFIREVRCKEETDEIGSDHIYLGGTATTPFGQTSLINQFQVSDDFDEGEKVTFGMSQIFTTWDLATQPDGFPYIYATLIAMAEKDDGGFYEFLKALWEKVDEEVKAAIAGLVGAKVGAAIGSIYPGIGTILGAIAGFLIGLFVGWLISLFNNEDDIIGVKTIILALGSSRKSYYDWAKLTTAEGLKFVLPFNGDGGRYEVTLSFKAFTQ